MAAVDVPGLSQLLQASLNAQQNKQGKLLSVFTLNI